MERLMTIGTPYTMLQVSVLVLIPTLTFRTYMYVRGIMHAVY
jgi:hypothetical protein